MARADFAFSHRFRVRYSEVDPQGVVFNSRYLEYADFAIVEYWRAMGLLPGDPGAPECHVGTATVRYVKPIRMDELIEACVRVDRFGTASMTWSIELHGANAEDLRARIELIYVAVDLATGRSQALPEPFKARVRAFQGEGVTA
jgi:acyl-CoA thioester hydrolase